MYFLQSHRAFLAEARDHEDFFNYLVRLMVIQPDWTQRVWVMSDVGSGRCSAFEQSYIVFEEECTRRYYPFICETGRIWQFYAHSFVKPIVLFFILKIYLVSFMEKT